MRRPSSAPQPKRIVVPADGPEADAIRTALALIARECEGNPESRRITLLIPSKHNVEHTALEEAIGAPAAKTLAKGRAVSSAGTPIELETEKTYRPYGPQDVILGVYATKKMLDLIDATSGCRLVVVVPWIMEELEDWIRTWSPTVLGQAPSPGGSVIANPVVEVALQSLTRRVNLSMGISHPSDRDAAVQLFKILKRHGETYDPDAVRMWAVQNGWSPGNADDLKDVGKKILEGRRMRDGGQARWNNAIIQHWRKEARPPTDEN